MKKKIIPIFSIMLVMAILFSGCTYIPSAESDDETGNNGTSQWTFDLEPGWNEITFTQEQLDVCENDHPNIVFDSITDIPNNEVSVYQDQDKLRTWSTELPDWACDLDHIWPDTIVSIHVTLTCTLIIG